MSKPHPSFFSFAGSSSSKKLKSGKYATYDLYRNNKTGKTFWHKTTPKKKAKFL